MRKKSQSKRFSKVKAVKAASRKIPVPPTRRIDDKRAAAVESLLKRQSKLANLDVEEW